ncbi:MAG: DUF4157 domain-containing protein [Gammaproteobacteria bacterium]|nr:MAG: DUF4157 domain-containing protein [Gammaproteobacteria bacterium]
MAAQRKATSAIHNSPHVTAQWQQLGSLAGKTAQREEAEEPLQPKAAQREEAPAKPNNTGLPDNLKSGIESLSGMPMDNVRVHYNSSQPAQLNALAYAQGTDIHVAPGQEQHLPHEAWHVVQQAQGRVQPTMQMKNGVPVNDDQGLEREADVMGEKALKGAEFGLGITRQANGVTQKRNIGFSGSFPVQMESASFGETTVNWDTSTLGGDPVGTKMEAKKLKKASIGKDTNLQGSPPGAGQQSTLMSYLPTNPKLSTANKYIKGHLLNHNIGGPGKGFNMFPITASANKTHLTAVEKIVKGWVGAGKTVDYTVEVTGVDASGLGNKGAKSGQVTANFQCDASNSDGDSLNQTIPSKLGEKSIAEESSVFVGLGNQGVFAAAYDWAVGMDDPTDMLWAVADKLAKKTGIDEQLMAEVLISIVLFDDTSDISEDASKAILPQLGYLKTGLDWKKELEL